MENNIESSDTKSETNANESVEDFEKNTSFGANIIDNPNVEQLEFNGTLYYILGTAHVSQKSVGEAKALIHEIKPDSVCVELCQNRYEAITNEKKWKESDVIKVIKEKKSFLLLANLIMGSFQKKIGAKLGVIPGAEMAVAVQVAKEINSEVVLADRDVQITLKRTWRSLPFMEKATVLVQLLLSLGSTEEISKEEIERLKEKDMLSEVMSEFSKHSPMVKTILINERDCYLAQKIKEANGKKVVVIVGAGHVAGMKKAIHQEHDLEALNQIPETSKITGLLKWIIPVLAMGLIIYGFNNAGSEVSYDLIYKWIFFNALLASIGGILALGHPITILTAAIASPISSLNPALQAGWFAGIVEATLHKPQVKDFENLGEDIKKIQGFWKNKVTKVLLTVVLVNLGSSIGAVIALSSFIATLN